MILQIIGIFIISLIANMQDFLGSSFIGRPVVTGFLVGLVFGDVTQGLIIGATLELAFMGLMGVGATVPPDEIIGGILATALALKNGYGVSVALTLVLPIATLGLLVKNLLYVVIFPAMAHRADKLASHGEVNKAADMHLWASITRVVMMTIVTTASFALGSGLVSDFVKLIPKALVDGITITTEILPAVGFAMLINMSFSKKVAPFFFLGFVCAAYLKLDMVAASIIGAIVAGIMYLIMDEIHKTKGTATVTNEEVQEDDF
ncbi:PTS mannose/fructose/sorbose/N-acetylgalactosamine transporter subunit IIC [Pediococcus acidilactici]|uniref:PTS mannose/fructose/sorbose/N-acetylgalactosamine transporter subunit IIC n=1 Tax=Pediococcus acidilactici TaxID=1254 RepID=UPI001F4D88D5|nr:PTS sugar transporter subunit IIC [Pediococcus acidilactici]MCH9267699.1 PTS sugar transporter subunit IIC [Pediococcus acidilactici]MCJ2387024.1 PTS sugar transporter subunit IIC [Pediococcus acidilactici]MCK2074914.1 PTS sugar transporter subunit IIC [Pediococcus acidilactici]MDM5041853.1 PTS sugar transporter subunit IIC [Pediococcus acidilactici]